MIDAMLSELDQEAQATRRLLERVPEDRLSWKPHPKSFSLGQIALHLAELPGGVSSMAAEEVYLLPQFQQKEAESRAELLRAFEAGLSTAREVAALLRSILLNHYYHHRGQLTVYLRLLNVPLPPTYGPTADENPFARPAALARTVPAAV